MSAPGGGTAGLVSRQGPLDARPVPEAWQALRKRDSINVLRSEILPIRQCETNDGRGTGMHIRFKLTDGKMPMNDEEPRCLGPGALTTNSCR